MYKIVPSICAIFLKYSCLSLKKQGSIHFNLKWRWTCATCSVVIWCAVSVVRRWCSTSVTVLFNQWYSCIFLEIKLMCFDQYRRLLWQRSHHHYQDTYVSENDGSNRCNNSKVKRGIMNHATQYLKKIETDYKIQLNSLISSNMIDIFRFLYVMGLIFTCIL